jgi:predicted transposase/invertase (TIGR01784 family)
MITILESWKREGERKGERKGIRKGKLEVVKQMLRENFSFDIISKCTGFPQSEIQKLAPGLN